MARGDGGKRIFLGEEDHLSFLYWLNDWIAARLAMSGSTYVGALVNRLLRDAKERRSLAAHERAPDESRNAVER